MPVIVTGATSSAWILSVIDVVSAMGDSDACQRSLSSGRALNTPCNMLLAALIAQLFGFKRVGYFELSK